MVRNEFANGVGSKQRCVARKHQDVALITVIREANKAN
jgi:hypothetical protein